MTPDDSAAGSAYEQILTEHVTLQDAIEAGCGHVLGSRAAPPRYAWEKPCLSGWRTREIDVDA
jgi:hypothetical protein